MLWVLGNEPARSTAKAQVPVWSAGKAELRQHLQRGAGKPYAARLADFHLLLYLAQQPGLEAASDLTVLVDAVHAGGAIPEGYQLIIDSLAEL